MSSHKKHPLTFFREAAEKKQKALKKAQKGVSMMRPMNVKKPTMDLTKNPPPPPPPVYYDTDPDFVMPPPPVSYPKDPDFVMPPSPYKDKDPEFSISPIVIPGKKRPRSSIEAFPSKMYKKGGSVKPSAGLSKKTKSNIAKKASAGKDIGKKGKSFAKVAAAAGGGEKGKRIAAAAMWKNIKRG